MRLFKAHGSSEVCWPLDDNETMNLEAESEEKSCNLVLNLGRQMKPIMY